MDVLCYFNRLSVARNLLESLPIISFRLGKVTTVLNNTLDVTFCNSLISNTSKDVLFIALKSDIKFVLHVSG